MALTSDQARKVVLKNLPEGSEIKSEILYQGKYLYIVYRPDPLEGRMLPFFSVDPDSGYFTDFSPADYDDSLKVIQALELVFKD